MLLLSSLTTGFFFFCFLAGGATAAPRNVTIDDQFGDELSRVRPTYAPTLGWTSGSTGLVKLNASLVHNGTWHDTTLHPGGEPKRVNFTFTGVSLYVYCVIANTPPGPTFFDADADYKFLIDGELVGRYTHEAAPNIPDYFYNTPVYVNTTLENKPHNFTLLMDSSDKPILLLFDYAVYTMNDETLVHSPSTDTSTALNQPTETPDQTGSSRTQVNVGVIVGPVIGGLFLIILIAVFLFRRRRKAQNAYVLEVSTPSPKFVETRVSESRDPEPEGDLVQEMREMRQELQRLRQQSSGTPPPYVA